MQKYRLSMVAFMMLLAPGLACAEYNADAIKAGVERQADTFQVEGWKLSENEKAWIAQSRAEGFTLAVNERGAGMVAPLRAGEQTLPAVIRCVSIGSVGLSPSSEQENNEIKALVQSALQGQKNNHIRKNGVNFEVKATEVGNSVYLSCLLRPVQ